jgi:hypothetical protein
MTLQRTASKVVDTGLRRYDGTEVLLLANDSVIPSRTLSAETLWLETLSATGRDDVRRFLEWRLRHGLSLSGAAEALGLSRRMIAYYSNGEKQIPRTVLLACKGWEADQAA